jgi:RNA polymerase-binding protein DksA
VKQLEQFHSLLISKRTILEGDVDAMGIQALKGSDGSGSGESHMPLHLADLGTDNYEQDFTLGLIESEEEEIREIDQAIERIEEGSFGICENCESHIPIERLKALPHSRLCIKCQTQYEQESGDYDPS